MTIISCDFHQFFFCKREENIDQVLKGNINYKKSHREPDYNINLWALTRILYCVNFFL